MNDKIKILIVEDENIVAFDISNILQRKLGYEVAGIVRSGEEAIEAARNLLPELILMDIILNGRMTGIEAAAIIKEKYNIPVIYLTAFSDKETLTHAKTTEPYGYLLKPLDEKVLHSAIEMAIYKARAEKIIRENEERYKMLIENSPVAIGVHCEGVIVYVNPSGVKLFGAASADDLIGKPIIQFIHHDYKKVINHRINRVRTTGMGVEGIPEKLITLDGRVIDVETAALPTKYNDKPAIEVVIRDISELKKKDRAQSALQKMLSLQSIENTPEEFCDSLYSAIREFMLIDFLAVSISVKETKTGVFLYMKNDSEKNETIFKLLDYTGEKKQTIFLDHNQLKKHNEDQGDTRLLYFIGVPFDLEDGHNVVVSAGISNPEIFFTIEDKELFELFADFSSRNIIKRIREKERQQEEQRTLEINTIKDKFLSVISHEVKNNFNSILGYTEVLKNDFKLLSQSEINSSIESLYSTSRNAYNLIEKLLRFIKFDSRTFTPNLKNISLTELLEREITAIKTLADKKNIDFIYSLDEDVAIFCDEELISTTIENIILYTVRYSKAGSRIEFKAVNCDDFIEISIIDNGTGIEEYLLKNLFILRDECLDDINSEKGIGFLLTRGIIMKCGGDLQVKSIHGQGSEIKIILPNASKKPILIP